MKKQSNSRSGPENRTAATQEQPGALRGEFTLGEIVYMNGNSLGPLPRRAQARIREVVDVEWGQGLIRSWNVHDWINLPQRIGNKIGKLLGAAPGQVVAGDSTSVCLFKLAAAAMTLQDRDTVLTEEGNFPTDLYVLEGLERLLNKRLVVRREPAEKIRDAIDERTALVVLTHVDYKSGAMHDMSATTAAAHRQGALMLWDLSHSTGAVPLKLDESRVDLAIGCSYKYLNGGPGAPAFSYVAASLQESLCPVVSGWMGHREPFAFSGNFSPATGIRRMAVGTPEVLALSVLDASLDLFEQSSMTQIRNQSLELSQLFIELVEERCADMGFTVCSPRTPEQRGSHVALTHEFGYAIMQALIARDIIGDFRAPNLIRFGFAPLYQRQEDVYAAVDALHSIVSSREYEQDVYKQRSFVT